MSKMSKLPLPSLISFEYVVQNVMVDPEDEQTVHWMGLESSEEAAWRQAEHNGGGGATAFQESKEMRLRYRLSAHCNQARTRGWRHVWRLFVCALIVQIYPACGCN